MSATRVIRFVVKPAVFAASLVPLGLLVRGALSNLLGANPIEAVTHTTGDWTLRFLLLTLAVTPVRWVTGWNPLARFRRMLGLFAFFYGALHLLTYVVLDKFFAWHEILLDVLHRRFILVGALAFAVLVPLAATSTAGMVRRMGFRPWQALHRLIYVSAVAGVVHYWWLVKADITKPRMYAVVLGALLTVRLAVAWRRRATARVRPRASISPSQPAPEAATGG
jgi:sulfoxide reductase heme-binding subunit YedZ